MIFVAYFARYSYLSREAGGCLGGGERGAWVRFTRRIPSFGGDLGLLSGNLRYFSRRIPLARADFWGIDRVIEAPFCEAIPPESDGIGAAFEGMDG